MLPKETSELKTWNTIGFALLLMPARMSADVSVAMEVKYGKATNEPSKRTLRIKGFEMRIESQRGSDARVTIYDLEKGKRFRLDASRREIFVLDLAAVSRRWKTQIIEEKLTRNIQSTGRREEISGMSCDEYTFELAANCPMGRRFRPGNTDCARQRHRLRITEHPRRC